jgi:hypothetical protein
MASVRIKFRLLGVFLLLLSPGFPSSPHMEIHAQAAPTKPQPPATVLLIRHAES